MSRRGVWQLSKLTLNYCEHSGSSRGVREFVAGGLDAFRQANPQLELVAALRPGRHPHAAAGLDRPGQRLGNQIIERLVDPLGQDDRGDHAPPRIVLDPRGLAFEQAALARMLGRHFED